MEVRAPPVWRIAKLALAEPIAALWVLAHRFIDRTNGVSVLGGDEELFDWARRS